MRYVVLVLMLAISAGCLPLSPAEPAIESAPDSGPTDDASTVPAVLAAELATDCHGGAIGQPPGACIYSAGTANGNAARLGDPCEKSGCAEPTWCGTPAAHSMSSVCLSRVCCVVATIGAQTWKDCGYGWEPYGL